MKVTRLSTSVNAVFIALAVACFAPARAYAHDEHTQMQAASVPSGPLVDVVRAATARFKNVEVARNAGYQLLFGCVSGGDFGAMGMHFVNTGLIGDLEVDPTNPEIVIYEPQADGSLRLIGADFLIFADAWDQAHPDGATPQLMGQLFHRFEAPNRFGLPAFYTLHVWAWKTNPTGTYTNWHSGVSCDAFGGERP
jgi:hypothetical protein